MSSSKLNSVTASVSDHAVGLRVAGTVCNQYSKLNANVGFACFCRGSCTNMLVPCTDQDLTTAAPQRAEQRQTTSNKK